MGLALAKQVEKRQRWLEEVIDFSSGLLSKCGQVLFYQEHSCHTTMTQELKGFHGFSFWSHGAYTMFGGEKLKVWFHNTLVLEIEWWDTQTLHVQVFDPSMAWRRKLTALMGKRGVVSAWAAAERAKLDKKTAAEKQQLEHKRELGRLQEEATRLLL